MDNRKNSSWFDNLDQFYKMLKIQESKLTAFTEIVGEGNNANRRINYELVTNLASKYLDIGNVYVDARKYKLAIACYEEAVLLNYTNKDMLFELLNRLSATYFSIENYSSSLSFVEKLFKMDPDYNIGLSRAIKCCIQLNEIDKSLIYYNKYLEKNKGSPEEELEKKEFQKKIEHKRLIIELKKRKLQFLKQRIEYFLDDVNTFNIKYSERLNCIHFDQTRLVWPVIFTCPEYKTIVFIKDFHEDASFYEHLQGIFSQKPIWDIKGKYTADSVNIYYDYLNGPSLKLMKIESKTCSLGNALAMLRSPIVFGIPTFMIFVAGGEHEKAALTDYPTYMDRFIK